MPDGAYDATEELTGIFPGPETVTIGKRVFTVRQLGLQEFGPVSNALKIACAAMGDGAAENAYVAEHIGELIPLIASATDKPIEFIAKLPGGVQLALFAAVMHVNRDFFVQCFALKFGDTAKLVVEMLGPGPPPSTSSATADTPSASDTPPQGSTGS